MINFKLTNNAWLGLYYYFYYSIADIAKRMTNVMQLAAIQKTDCKGRL